MVDARDVIVESVMRAVTGDVCQCQSSLSYWQPHRLLSSIPISSPRLFEGYSTVCFNGGYFIITTINIKVEYVSEFYGLGRLSKKKNCKILDICQISVTLPTLYPDMDIKKFGHIFYTLTYLPIKKIWTNLEKSWYSYKAFRLFETYYYRLSPRDIG